MLTLVRLLLTTDQTFSIRAVITGPWLRVYVRIMPLIAGSSVLLRRQEEMVEGRCGSDQSQTLPVLHFMFADCSAGFSQSTFFSQLWAVIASHCLMFILRVSITANYTEHPQHSALLCPRHIPSRLINQEQTISILSNGRGSFPPVTPAC